MVEGAEILQRPSRRTIAACLPIAGSPPPGHRRDPRGLRPNWEARAGPPALWKSRRYP